ncbi:hypothetical protein AHAS_Ahas13G0287600 [Arachis hypogaea]
MTSQPHLTVAFWVVSRPLRRGSLLRGSTSSSSSPSSRPLHPLRPLSDYRTFVLVSLAGWGAFIYGNYKFFTRGKGNKEEVHILVNFTGKLDGTYSTVANTVMETFNKIFAVNTWGMFLCCREAKNRMKCGGRRGYNPVDDVAGDGAADMRRTNPVSPVPILPYLQMYNRSLCSACTRTLSHVTASTSKFIVHADNYNYAIPKHRFPNAQHLEPLTTQLESLFRSCSDSSLLPQVKQIHAWVTVCGMSDIDVLGSRIAGLYVLCGSIRDARNLFFRLELGYALPWNWMIRGLFDSMPQTDTVTWNGLIAGYVQNGLADEALTLFNAMISASVKPDSITFASFLPSIVESGSSSTKHCKEIHGYIVRHRIPFDVYLKSSLIDVYLKNRDVDTACKIFQQNTSVDVAVCTAMISGYEGMVPNCLTMAAVLPACAASASLRLGKELHCVILKNQLDSVLHVGSAITDIRMPERDSVCWNSLITSFSQNGKPEMAINIFRGMGRSGTKFDSVSLSSALSASANIPALYSGKEMHGFVIRNAFTSDTIVTSALIDMYSKCGKLAMAQYVFDLMYWRNEISWNSIIAAYGNHGRPRECLDLFHEMLKAGIHPDHVTFLVIISACAHAGLVDEGISYFRCLTESYGICAKMEHYACMVDLYGRVGCLHEALDTIKSMPRAPDAGVWGTLLGACRVHGNVELARLASEHLLELDPQNSGYYVLLSNIHAGAGEWSDVLKIRSRMKEKGVQKICGYSWIDVNGSTHMFSAADGSHPQSFEIYMILESRLLELKKQGYVPQPYLPLHPQVVVKT